MKLPDIPFHLLNEISDAAVLLNHEYIVVYANKIFEKLFTVTHNNKRILFNQELSELNLNLQKDGGLSPHQQLFVPLIGRKCDAYVYLINMPKAKSCYLVIIKLEQENKDFPSFEPVAVTNPHIGEKEIHSEKLSPEFKRLIGNDLRFKSALFIAQKAARSDLPVLIIGDSGTGKEILALAIHKTSHRKDKPLVDVNCAAIPDTLIESELFGYEKGAFTGANSDGRRGYFDEGHGGTIFMDEIGDASLQTQSKLLRVLEDGCFKRVGGNRNIKVDVRIISATNRNLKSLIDKKTFRDDLFYRLNTFAIYLPTLRERRGDITLLVNYFLNEHVRQEKRDIEFSSESLQILQSYHWPGNVRELKGVVSYAVNMTTTPVIYPGSLPSFLFTDRTNYHKEDKRLPSYFNTSNTLDLTTAIQHVERHLIEDVLQKSANRTEAIRALGISRRTFYIKIKQYGLE
jgi:transcriptional regulator with PAS, ATPase and Fis domain